jgi:hypothetical protein
MTCIHPNFRSACLTPRPFNGLGLAGFIVSLLALIYSAGMLSPVGLVLSFFALFRRPRGFAIAGFVLGLIGSAWIVAVLLLGLVVVGAAAAGVAAASGAIHDSAQVDATRDAMNSVCHAIVSFENETGKQAYDLGLLEPRFLSGPVNDAWGRPVHLVITGDHQYLVSSDGPDGVQGTPDDLSQRYESVIHSVGARKTQPM